MTAIAAENERELIVDVAIAGGGLAGLAAAAHLAKSDARVVCIEPRPWPRPAVGESLEFSAPRLLADLGVDVDCSHDVAHLFPKDSVAIGGNDASFTVWPPTWFGGPPIWCPRIAYHTDRIELDRRLAELAVERGVEILPERVTQVHHDHDVIGELVTDRGTRVRARWFIDATGHSRRLFGRELGLELETLGPQRTAYWGRFDEPPEGHATRLHFPDSRADDLAWVWEIPLNQGQVSIGAVLSTRRFSELRQRGLQPRDVFVEQLRPIPRLERILADHPSFEVHAAAYTPCRHRRTIGPNWLLVGDAAAMVDPLTSNGITSALRHAESAARTVTRALEGGRVGRRQAWAYENTVPTNVVTLNRAIESFLYQPAVRQRLGLRWAVNLYAATGVITNSLYARIGQTSLPRSAGTAAMLAASRLWTRIGSAAVGRLPRLSRSNEGVASSWRRQQIVSARTVSPCDADVVRSSTIERIAAQ